MMAVVANAGGCPCAGSKAPGGPSTAGAMGTAVEHCCWGAL